MKLLIDTNVVLDYLEVRDEFADDAEKIFELALQNKAIELVSASAATDIFYNLARNLHDKKLAQESLRALLEYIKILPVTESDIVKALDRNWKDFEDAVQYTVAESNNVDYIITRNTRDFEENDIIVITPKDFIKDVIPHISI